MKYIKTLIIALVVCFVLSACNVPGGQPSDYFGFKTSEFTVVEEKDTHGGFHSDGTYYLILDCSEKTEQAKECTKDWKPLPLTENLQLAMYGGSRGGVSYGYNFAEEAHWPVINNGVYKFIDRHAEAADQTDDTNLLSRASFNFSIAVYDFDTDILYYFEMDT